MEKNEINEKNESKLEEDKIKGRILLGVLIVTILFIAIIFINLLIKNPEENILNNNVLNDVYNKYGIPSIDKPVIYLYPEEKTEVTVKLANKDKLTNNIIKKVNILLNFIIISLQIIFILIYFGYSTIYNIKKHHACTNTSV